MDGASTGRCLRERKPVNYTFDDYDRSITEAIELTKQGQLSPNPCLKMMYPEKTVLQELVKKLMFKI